MKVFIAITEEWYGGKDQLKVFADKRSAEKYKWEIEENNNNILIIIQEHDVIM